MLFIGDDWAEHHHDIEVQDANGRTLRRARLPEGMPGIRRFGEIIGEFLPADDDAEDVAIGIETDRGPWVQALLAAGYQVYGIDPKQAHRHREILGSSAAREREAIKVTRTLWPTWCAPAATNSALPAGTPRSPTRSRSSPAPTRT